MLPTEVAQNQFETFSHQQGTQVINSKLPTVLLALLAALSTTATPATELNPASHGNPMVEFSQAETHQIFDQTASKTEIAILSPQEMKDTEGAWLWNTVAWTAGGGALGATTYLWTTPQSQWSWGGAGTAFGSGATAGFYSSTIPLAAFGAVGSYTLGTVGAAGWYR